MFYNSVACRNWCQHSETFIFERKNVRYIGFNPRVVRLCTDNEPNVHNVDSKNHEQIKVKSKIVATRVGDKGMGRDCCKSTVLELDKLHPHILSKSMKITVEH